jgi:hypothetical protein
VVLTENQMGVPTTKIVRREATEMPEPTGNAPTPEG